MTIVTIHFRDAENGIFEHIATMTDDSTNAAGGPLDLGTILERAYRRTQNIEGSWSQGPWVLDAPNPDYSPTIARHKPNRTYNGIVYGHRSSTVGDRFAIEGQVWEVASFGFDKLHATHPQAFADWSPAELAHVLGFTVDLRTDRSPRGMVRGRTAWYVKGDVAFPLGHAEACRLLSAMAVIQGGIDPADRPVAPRALVDGKPQPASAT